MSCLQMSRVFCGRGGAEKRLLTELMREREELHGRLSALEKQTASLQHENSSLHRELRSVEVRGGSSALSLHARTLTGCRTL